MILLINICKERLHYYEFVKPIEDIIKACGKEFNTIGYKDVSLNNLMGAEKIIISGTSLQDFSYSEDSVLFSWIKKQQVPILGICGGMQLLCRTFGCEMIEGQEIGLIKAKFSDDFLGMAREKEIYALHNMAVKEDARLKDVFDIFSKTKYVQAIKHKTKPFYGVLFHPEVRNKGLIEKFLCS
jgi:GMP synthase (glutamine-hydrolysing)